jgi:hypothetical protein
MGTRPSYLAVRTALLLLSLAPAASACVTTQSGSAAAGIAGREAVAERGPRVRIWTTDEFGTGSRVRAAFRLDDDAYVAVVNVGLDGYASVIFPESPDDDGFMRGGRTYRLPSFFTGFANHFHASRYGRLYNAASAYDGFYDRYAGYVFIIASWRPMNFRAVEELGLWDDYRLAAHERQLEPYQVMHQFAQRLVPGRSRDYSAHFARYAAFSVPFGRASSFASCLFYGSTLGYLPWWTFHAVGSWWTPHYAIGYYGAGRCPYGARLASYRTRRIVGPPPVQPPPPVRPAPPPGPDDSAATSKPGRRPRRPVVEGDSGGPKVPVGRHVADEETIIDVTRETRDLARRRDRDADRIDRAVRRPRGYGTSDDGTPSGRAGVGRADDRWDDDRGPRGRRAPVDRDAPARARSESARGERARADQRPSEPRREPPRPVERSEPRQTTRPQAPQRSEPAPRPEPRSERRVNPSERR